MPRVYKPVNKPAQFKQAKNRMLKLHVQCMEPEDVSLRLVMQTSRLETSPKGDSSQIVSFTGSAREREPGSSWWREIIF
jgi:hypothetical protein